MTRKIEINGVIIPDEYSWYYELMEEPATSPQDVKSVLSEAAAGDEIDVYINSPGGAIDAGSEIYTLLREASASYDVTIYVTGEACSAASIIAMSAYCEMSPTSLMMVHCVSAKADGNHNEMEKMAEVLQTADEALCSAYMAKSGMSKEDALAMMEAETWLTAEQALDKGLIDGIMFENAEEPRLVAGPLFALPSDEQLARARALRDEEANRAARNKKSAALRLKALKLKNTDSDCK